MKIKNLRFKAKNKKSAINLLSEEGIKLIETESGSERKILIKALIKGLERYSFKNGMVDTFDRFLKRIFSYYKLNKLRISENVSQFSFEQKSLFKEIYNNICRNGSHYIGKLVEYVFLRICKKSYNKIHHECYVYHKRKSLQSNDDKFRRKILDLIKVERGYKIDLYECKANLHIEFHNIKLGRNDRLVQKIRLMKHLEGTLKSCITNNAENNYPQVNKHLLTVVRPTNQHTLANNEQRNINVVTFKDILSTI